MVTKRISRRDHEEAFGGGVGKNFDSPKDFSWWPKESHGETARFLMVTKTSRWDHEEPLVVGSRSNWAFTKRKSLYLTVRISWSPRGIHGPRGHCVTFMKICWRNTWMEGHLLDDFIRHVSRIELCFFSIVINKDILGNWSCVWESWSMH